MILGRLLRTKRKEKGLTLCDVANQLKMQQTNVSRWELGTSRPSAGHLIDIIRLLDISKSELMEVESE